MISKIRKYIWQLTGSICILGSIISFLFAYSISSQQEVIVISLKETSWIAWLIISISLSTNSFLLSKVFPLYRDPLSLVIRLFSYFAITVTAIFIVLAITVGGYTPLFRSFEWNNAYLYTNN
jgi:hypothetical protein